MWNDLPFSVFDTGKLVGFKGAVKRWLIPRVVFASVFRGAVACGVAKAIYNFFLFLLRPVLLVLIIILLMFIRRCNILIFFYPFSRNILVTKLMTNHMPNLVRL